MTRTMFLPRHLAAALTVLMGANAYAGECGHPEDLKPVAMDPATLNVGFFGKNAAMLAAQNQGFFAAQNLTVNYLQIQSSEQAFTDLRDGRYDIALASIDNVVNFRLNPSNALGAVQPVQAFMSVDYASNLTLAGRSGITAVEDLRGKKVAVDAPASGFAYVAYDILANHGLQKDVDYTTVSIGGGLGRFNALLAGTVDGTLLNAGFEIRAAAQGRPLFENVYDVANPYLGTTGDAMEPWMQAHPAELIRFIRAYVAASAWAFDPANRTAAVASLVAPGITLPVAEQIFDASVTPGKGMVDDAYIGQFERDGLANVLFLRQKYDGFEIPQDLKKLSKPAGKLFDMHWYHQAVGESCEE
jgi:ABC-type nitrate/sulfonate/bicarbonate transport system substrate-binding protein